MNTDQKMAQYINLIYFIPTSIISIIIFAKQKLIDFRLAITISLFGICGSIVGSMISLHINTKKKKKIFAVFLMAIAIYEIISWYKKYAKKA